MRELIHQAFQLKELLILTGLGVLALLAEIFNFKKYLLYASLIPKFVVDKEFRHQVAVFKISPNKICFENETMDHFRLVFEKI